MCKAASGSSVKENRCGFGSRPGSVDASAATGKVMADTPGSAPPSPTLHAKSAAEPATAEVALTRLRSSPSRVNTLLATSTACPVSANAGSHRDNAATPDDCGEVGCAKRCQSGHAATR